MVLLCAMGIENQKFLNEPMDVRGSKDLFCVFEVFLGHRPCIIDC